MIEFFPKALGYLQSLDLNSADPLDKKAKELLDNPDAYERASQALRRRFVRGATVVDGVDKGARRTQIKRESVGGKYLYSMQGADGNWFQPEERIWVVAMYALWQDNKK